MQPVTTILTTAAWALARTWRLQVVGNEHVAATHDRGLPVVFAVWHASLLPPLWHRRGERITLLVSAHRDGRRLGDAARRWGYDVVHGSSTRGATSGFRELVRALRRGHDAAVTPDGPRGPARRAKPGIVEAARLGRGAIVPVAAAARRAWRFGSWDRFLLPRPFATVRVVYGTPIAVPADDARPVTMARLESALQETERIAQWW